MTSTTDELMNQRMSELEKQMADQKGKYKKELTDMKSKHKKEMADVKDRIDNLENFILKGCYKYESEAFLFRLSIEEFYRKKKKEIMKSNADDATKQRSLNGLNRWFEEAKARRTKRIWGSSGAGGAIAAAGYAFGSWTSGASTASVVTNIAAAVGSVSTTAATAIVAVGSKFGAVAVVGGCVIGACLLLAGGSYAYVKLRDW